MVMGSESRFVYSPLSPNFLIDTVYVVDDVLYVFASVEGVVAVFPHNEDKVP